MVLLTANTTAFLIALLWRHVSTKCSHLQENQFTEMLKYYKYKKVPYGLIDRLID